MIGEVMAYAASRAAGGAAENISRRAAWFAAGGAIFVLGLVFAVLAAFWALQPHYGPIQSAAMIAGASLLAALVCFAVPAMVQAGQKSRAKANAETVSPVAETIDAVKVEAAEAVDYFGPAKVMASAFMLGLGAAKQLRR